MEIVNTLEYTVSKEIVEIVDDIYKYIFTSNIYSGGDYYVEYQVLHKVDNKYIPFKKKYHPHSKYEAGAQLALDYLVSINNE